MKTEIKEKWLTALRSGEYKQTEGRLQGEGKFCCLGVLSDLYAKENNIEWEDTIFCYKSLLGSGKVLPIIVKEWAGLKDTNPYINIHNDYKRLACINDEGMSFEGISQLIEQQL